MEEEHMEWIAHIQEEEEEKGLQKETDASKGDESSRKPQPSGPPEKRKRMGKKTSTIWDHFTEVPSSNPEKAACNYCGHDYASSTKTCGTKSLWNHLDRCKKYPYSAINDDKQKSIYAFTKKSTTDDSEDVASTTQPKLNQKEIRHEIASYFILDELPFKHVNGRGFQRLMKKAFPHVELHSRITVQKDIYQLYLDSKKKLKNELKIFRVSLTTDCWTSIQNIGYMCLTAHWIDNNWKLQKRIISFVQVPSHKGEMIGKELIACLNEWGITKVFSITVDNAASNSVALMKVKEHLQEMRHGIVLNGEMFHMRCCAHIINLIVCDGLKELGGSIASVRNAVRYVRSSSERLKRFKEACKEVNIESKALLCLDVVTRWNSTYMMLVAALKFKKAFKNLEADANYTRYFEEERLGGIVIEGPPQRSDWDQVEVFVTFLKKFYDLTMKFSGSLYVTANLFFQDILDVHSLLQELAQEPHTLLGKMAANMQLKYDKYWGKIEKMNLLMFVATVLDPRFKMEVLKTGFAFIYDAPFADKMIKAVEIMLRRLYDFYKEMTSPPPPQRQVPIQGSNAATSSSTVASLTSSTILAMRSSSWVKLRSQLDKKIETNDLDYYLNDRRERLSDDHFDILGWWKNNGSKYKVVSQIAKDVLAVQVSTVASESAFSTGGRILDQFKSSLSPKMVEALICSKNWLVSEEEEDELIALIEYMDEVQGWEESLEVASGDGSCITSAGN